MNLQKACTLLITGTAWTLFHKIILGLFPALYSSAAIKTVSLILWTAAGFTIILFAWYFLKEVHSQSTLMKHSLRCVIICTGIILITHLPVELTGSLSVIKKAVFTAARFLNSAAMFVFALEFYRTISDYVYSLKPSLLLTFWAYGSSAVLQFFAGVFLLSYHLFEIEISLHWFFQPAAFLIFLFTAFAVINFLLNFRKIDDYSRLLQDI